jgi:hypothetical protein
MNATYTFFIILIKYISENQLKMVEFRGKCMYFHNNHETQLKPTLYAPASDVLMRKT